MWAPFPFVRISLVFVAGTLLGIFWPDAFSLHAVVVVLLVSAVLYVVAAFLPPQQSQTTAAGVFALASMLLLGYYRAVNFNAARSPDHLINVTTPIQFYTARLCGQVEERGNFWRVEAQTQRVMTHGRWAPATAQILLYISKKTVTTPYSYGDVLLIRGAPQRVAPPANPGEFDYSRFLAFKNNYHQHFLNKTSLTLVGHDDAHPLYSLSLQARVWARAVLGTYITDKQAQAIACALVLGVAEGLDSDLLGAYAATGTLHVLSVSGLHVSIVYLLIVMLFKPLGSRTWARWLLAATSIVLLWAYAFVTGLSPSVLRAVTMFSFMAAAKAFERRSGIYNTLALSAMCLLLYDPYLIMSVGFQLSFLAVLGIVYLQPMIYQWWAPQSKILDEVWKATSVSIAAQLATFGLGLLYFNQFPSYFLLANFLVIPASYVVLIGGLLLLAFSFVKPIALAIGFLMGKLISLMNYLIFCIDKWPGSLVQNVYINSLQYWLLALALVFVILLFQKRRYTYFTIALVPLALFSGIQWMNFYKQYTAQKITFYKIPGHTAFDIFDRGHAYAMADTALQRNKFKIKFHITPNRILNRVSAIKNIEETHLVRNLHGCRVIAWQGTIIVHITGANAQMPALHNVDYVLVSNNAVRDLITIQKYITYKKLIIDSSNSFYLANKLVNQGRQQKSDVYSVWHSGALVARLN